MARSTQFIGHTTEVSTFLKTCEKLEKCGEVAGMFGEHVYDLHKYKDSRGNVWKEKVQAEPWSSGPMIFLCIEKVSSEKQIQCGWKQDDSVRGQEFDYELGLFWV